MPSKRHVIFLKKTITMLIRDDHDDNASNDYYDYYYDDNWQVERRFTCFIRKIFDCWASCVIY